MGRRLKTALAIVLCLTSAFSGVGCKKQTPELYRYEKAEYMTYGFWAPYEMTEESFEQYKDCGMNTLLMVNHSGARTTDEQFYLGSNRTQAALELCRKTGLDAILNYGSWLGARIEKNFDSETPFSTYRYEEYEDIIKGVHISDEPKKIHWESVFDQTRVEDFKEVYPNGYYYINLFGGPGATLYDTYEEYVDAYFEYVNAAQFNKKWVSVDFYPYGAAGDTQLSWLQNYEVVAKAAKKNNAEFACYLQSGTGGELRSTMRQGEMLQQMNVALCYGVRDFGYYCYAVPKGTPLGGMQFVGEDGTNYMYSQTILNYDGTPSEIYYYVQAANQWLADLADAIFAYSWTESFAVHGENDYGSALDFISDRVLENRTLKSVTATENVLVGCFDGEKGEAYLMTNFVDPQYETAVELTATFTDVQYVGVYTRGNEPCVVKLENGKYSVNLGAGEAVFLVPLV